MLFSYKLLLEFKTDYIFIWVILLIFDGLLLNNNFSLILNKIFINQNPQLFLISQFSYSLLQISSNLHQIIKSYPIDHIRRTITQIVNALSLLWCQYINLSLSDILFQSSLIHTFLCDLFYAILHTFVNLLLIYFDIFKHNTECHHWPDIQARHSESIGEIGLDKLLVEYSLVGL